MLSHDLARALLARRNNDVRIEVLVDDDPTGERGIWASRVELRDCGVSGGSIWQLPSSEVVTYDDEDDTVVVRAAFVVVGEPDA